MTRFYISYTIPDDSRGTGRGSGFAFMDVTRWSEAVIWELKESIAKGVRDAGVPFVQAKNIVFLTCIALEE